MLRQTRLALSSISIYRNILQDPVVHALKEVLDQGIYQSDLLKLSDDYYSFLNRVFCTRTSFQRHFMELILFDDNPFSWAAEMERFKDIDPVLLAAVKQDLKHLQYIYRLDLKQLEIQLQITDSEIAFNLPVFKPGSMAERLARSRDWPTEMENLACHYSDYSRGIAARYQALHFSAERGLEGIDKPDMPVMDDLIGCSRQKDLLCCNTENFLAGYPANNVLLFGPRGTGKSSMIKSLLKKYEHKKLRLLEIKREQIDLLPQAMRVLGEYSLKFIIFIDDLSFEEYETGYKGLKAVLEGGVLGPGNNVLIYATSNRRHLVREFFSDRGKMGEEVHSMDTMQEKLSLADRFGLSLSFETPDKHTYLQIVEHLAQKSQISLDLPTLHSQALEWERSRHGPSGRTARQFIDSLARSQR